MHDLLATYTKNLHTNNTHQGAYRIPGSVEKAFVHFKLIVVNKVIK